MISDFHTHSFFSGDSNENPENMISTAINLNMPYFCFTDHLDLDYPEPDVCFDLDIAAYYPQIYKFKEKYIKKINICIGMETGLEPYLAERLHEKVNLFPFDYIIGSSHLVNRKDPYYPDFFENRSNKEAFTEYFESIISCLSSCEDFDVYGHLDYVIRYTPDKSHKFSYFDYTDLIDTILKKIISKDKGIELNTGGFLAGLNSPNPSADIIKRYHELGGEIITVGSDAHQAFNIGSHFDAAASILKSCGYDYYTVFKDRKPIFLSL